MVICAVYASDEKLRRGFAFERVCYFRSCGIYSLAVAKPKKLRRCVKMLKKVGISRAVCEESDVENVLSKSGITVFGDSHVRSAAAAEAARIYAESAGAEKTFLVRGGTPSEEERVVCRLLRFARHVFLDSTRFSEVAESVFSSTGAVIERAPKTECVRVSLSGDGEYIGLGENKAEVSDFDFQLDDADFGMLPPACRRKLISALIACGAVSQNEVRVSLAADKNRTFT